MLSVDVIHRALVHSLHAGALMTLATSIYAEGTVVRAPAPIVYFDIAGPADAKLSSFYERAFGWASDPGGVVSVPVSAPQLPGTLRTDPAAKVIYIGVSDVAAALGDVTANGGKVISARFEVKGVAVLGLFTDPAGNAMGLVELTNGKPTVP